MKIALLTDSDVFAGTERHILDLGVELRALGVEPTLICPVHGMLAERGRGAGLPVRGVEDRGRVGLAAVRQLNRWLTTGTFNVVHAHNGRTAVQAALARRLVTQRRRGALVATQHFLEPTRAQRTGLARQASRAIHALADREIRFHIAISQAVGDALLARGETAPEKLRVVLNGIRDPREQTLTPRAEVRARLKIPADAPLTVCLARLEPEKGVDTLLDALVETTHALPGVHCVIAGGGSLEFTLRERLTQLRLAPAVRLLGFVEDSLSLVQAADLFVLPSLAEPFGLSIVEAMALGKPVVATRAGGPLEIVREGKTGHLVPPGAPAPLAAAMVDILSQPEAVQRMGMAAREDYQLRFTAGRMAREILAVYREAA